MVLSRRAPLLTCPPELAAAVFGALAHPHRLAIIRALAERDRDVTELATILRLSVAATSHHLVRLRQAGLVTSHRDGIHVLNRLARPEVAGLAAAACNLVERPR